jgi:TDG/mug DNA glycosylase family protein
LDVLPDVLRPGLTVVFCGTAAGNTSARARAYYAHPRNRFWQILHDSGLTDRKLLARDYAELQMYNIGLTDLCKLTSGNDDELPPGSLKADRLLAALGSFKPRYLAFISRAAGRVVCGKMAEYGRQQPQLGTQIFILPTTSPRWGEGWWGEKKRHWYEFADAVRSHVHESQPPKSASN